MRKTVLPEYRYSATKFISSLKGSEIDFFDPKGAVANLFSAVFQFSNFLPLLMVVCWAAACIGGGCVPSVFASTYETDISQHCGEALGGTDRKCTRPDSRPQVTAHR